MSNSKLWLLTRGQRAEVRHTLDINHLYPELLSSILVVIMPSVHCQKEDDLKKKEFRQHLLIMKIFMFHTIMVQMITS